MGFFNGLMSGIKKFKEAAKAGADFNPLLEEVIKELEKLHSEGKLNDVIYKAEQAYVKEHGEYKAKGTHTNAQESKNDAAALKHFMAAIAEADGIEGPLKEKIGKLEGLQKAMEDALGPLGKLL